MIYGGPISTLYEPGNLERVNFAGV